MKIKAEQPIIVLTHAQKKIDVLKDLLNTRKELQIMHTPFFSWQHLHKENGDILKKAIEQPFSQFIISSPRVFQNLPSLNFKNTHQFFSVGPATTQSIRHYFQSSSYYKSPKILQSPIPHLEGLLESFKVKMKNVYFLGSKNRSFENNTKLSTYNIPIIEIYQMVDLNIENYQYPHFDLNWVFISPRAVRTFFENAHFRTFAINKIYVLGDKTKAEIPYNLQKSTIKANFPDLEELAFKIIQDFKVS